MLVRMARAAGQRSSGQRLSRKKRGGLIESATASRRYAGAMQRIYDGRRLGTRLARSRYARGLTRVICEVGGFRSAGMGPVCRGACFFHRFARVFCCSTYLLGQRPRFLGGFAQLFELLPNAFGDRAQALSGLTIGFTANAAQFSYYSFFLGGLPFLVGRDARRFRRTAFRLRAFARGFALLVVLSHFRVRARPACAGHSSV